VAVTFDPTASGDDTESDEGDPIARLDKAFADREEQIVRMSSVAASDATTRIPEETMSEMEKMIWKEMEEEKLRLQQEEEKNKERERAAESDRLEKVRQEKEAAAKEESDRLERMLMEAEAQTAKLKAQAEEDKARIAKAAAEKQRLKEEAEQRRSM